MKVHIVTGNEKLCKLYFTKLVFQNVLACIFYRYHYIGYFIYSHLFHVCTICTEAATGGVLFKKMFLKILQISQENACVGVAF